MIVVDIETSGVTFADSGIVQIGAVDFENPARTFNMECRIDPDETCMHESLELTGLTEQEIRDEKRMSQKELLEKFFAWCARTTIKNFMCHNPQFDFAFLKTKAEKYDLELPMHWRCLDLHSMACLKYMQVYGQLHTTQKRLDMGLPNILRFCGMDDPRNKHDGLEDAELTAECFSRIMYGKNLLEKYAQFEIPEYLQE
jgi:DNA polymerase III epsilon subunit-like protein